ncbi:uncharacterized protein BKCO1_1000386 [Diplodia corticola]|uniref:Tat pathway signal sequence n=1 Tax=Diplodia corticola TaxID=236234 RepID=A0A1J9SKI3_9PEZI|nr:uncharacterized protein BKCO1_1000386 [Diplodia corticola]OJD40252.1 hypothetical protein BKCO1_1000386 [Diplodia corticola]
MDDNGSPKPSQPSLTTMASDEQHAIAPTPPIKAEWDVSNDGEDRPLLISNTWSTPLVLEDPSEESRFTSGLPSLCETPSKKGSKRDHVSFSSEVGQQPFKRHDPVTEPPPKMATNHASFHSAELIAHSIPEEIVRDIRDNAYTDEDFEFLKEKACGLSKIYQCGEIKVGFKGVSGTGKSSLINSLLGYNGLAPSGGYGEACTAVVQEFRKPRPSQEMPCEAEVTFLLPQARETALKDWVRNFWDSYKAGTSEDGEDDEDSTEKDVDQAIQEGEVSTTATDALFSLFADHEECASPEATKQFLITATSREDPNLLGRLKRWTDSLLKSLGVTSSELIIKAHTPDDLRDQLAQFLAHVDRQQPSPWPFVQLVKCFFDCPLLSQDIVLADLPGTSDINRTRVQATNVYMRDVDYTGVVAKIDRAQSNADAHKSLVEAYKRKRGKNVFMAVTKSDSGISDESGLVDKYINMPGASAGDIKRLLLLKEELDSIKIDSKSFQLRQKQALSQRDYDLVESLAKQNDVLETRETSVLAKIRESCLELRNNKVRQALVNRNLGMMKQEILPVFCVSSMEYMKHIVGDEDHPPIMSVEATGIPRLRAHVYSLPADRKIMAFKHHVKYKLPSLLHHLTMTCSQSKLRRKEELQNILVDALKPLSNEISQVFKDLLSDGVLSRLGKIKKNKATYITAAAEKLKVYAKWKPSTQKAFCRNKGRWKTPKVGFHDWNCAILEPLIKDMKTELRPWEDVSEPLGHNLSDKVVGALQGLIGRLQDSTGPSHNILQPFFDEMRLNVDMLDEACKSEAQAVENGLCSIRDCLLLTAEPKDCYFLQLLEKIYVECAAINGPGSNKVRMRLLQKKIFERGPANPFHKCHDKAKIAAQKLFQRHAESFADKVLDTFQHFHDMLLRLFKTDENDTPEAKALRELIRSKLPVFKAKIAECERLLQESLEA